MPADDSRLPSAKLNLADAVLRMSPEGRLEHNHRMATMAEELRAGLAAATEEPA